jgi:hypothetical protein
MDDGNAFIPDTTGQLRPIPAADAESFAEEFIDSALAAGGSVKEDAADEVGDDEDGGPFIVLDDEGRLPAEPAEMSTESQSYEPAEKEQLLRGARWASRN